MICAQICRFWHQTPGQLLNCPGLRLLLIRQRALLLETTPQPGSPGHVRSGQGARTQAAGGADIYPDPVCPGVGSATPHIAHHDSLQLSDAGCVLLDCHTMVLDMPPVPALHLPGPCSTQRRQTALYPRLLSSICSADLLGEQASPWLARVSASVASLAFCILEVAAELCLTFDTCLEMASEW